MGHTRRFRSYRNRNLKGQRRAERNGAAYEDIRFHAVIERDENRCWMCGRTLEWAEIRFDHLIPLSRGGAHVFDNVWVACEPCDTRKGNRLPCALADGDVAEPAPACPDSTVSAAREQERASWYS